MHLQKIKHLLLKLIAWARINFGMRLFKSGKLLIAIGTAMAVIPYFMGGTMVLYSAGAVMVLLSRATKKEKIKWVLHYFLYIVGIYVLIFLIIMIFYYMEVGIFE